jgi:hypothetical protein
VPFGLLTALAGIAIAPGLRGRDTKIGDRPAILSAADFGVCTDVSNQNYLIHATSHASHPACRPARRRLIDRRTLNHHGPPMRMGGI